MQSVPQNIFETVMTIYKCDVCGLALSCQSNLSIHIISVRVHLSVSNWLCELCKVSAGTQTNLKKHVQRCHEKVKNFK
jgi:uncharacterized Zn-finger protein